MRNDINTRKKISESLKRVYKEGRRKPVCFKGATNPFYGKCHSEETKRKNREWHKGKSLWNKGKKGVMPIPWNKGKKLPSPWNKGKKLPHLSGDKHPGWIKDRTKVKTGDRDLNDPLQKQWRREVKNRDNWKCRISNKDCSGRLEAHHILRWQAHPELRYEVNNGITLCHFHHPRKIIDEMRLAPVFKRLVKHQSAPLSH